MLKTDEETLRQIDKFITDNYGPEKPTWLFAGRDMRKHCIIEEYGRLTKIHGLSDRRARETLARLIGRGIKAVEHILYD